MILWGKEAELGRDCITGIDPFKADVGMYGIPIFTLVVELRAVARKRRASSPAVLSTEEGHNHFNVLERIVHNDLDFLLAGRSFANAFLSGHISSTFSP